MAGAAAVWRPMAESDLQAVNAVGAIVHPLFPEDEAVVAERLRLFPAGCFVADAEGRVVGYCIAHQGKSDAPPPLNSLLGALPRDPDCLYLHDLAILPAWRSRGLGRSVLDRLELAAAECGTRMLALTAVNSSVAYWGRRGFAVVDGPGLAAKLASYGPDARLMTRRCRQDRPASAKLAETSGA